MILFKEKRKFQDLKYEKDLITSVLIEATLYISYNLEHKIINLNVIDYFFNYRNTKP